jgi:hypothetical protein
MVLAVAGGIDKVADLQTQLEQYFGKQLSKTEFDLTTYQFDQKNQKLA